MCVVSMVIDHWKDNFPYRYPNSQPYVTTTLPLYLAPEVTRAEFEQLKKDLLDLKDLIKRAKKYDEDNNEPDCEMDEKVALLKKVAKLVGVDFNDVLGEKHGKA